MKRRTAEGVMFIIAFINGISGFLRPAFRTTRALHLLWKAAGWGPPACLDWGLFLSDLWDTSPSELRGDIYTPTAPAGDRVPAECRHPHSRTGVHDLTRPKLPVKVPRAALRREMGDLWQRGGQRLRQCCLTLQQHGLSGDAA